MDVPKSGIAFFDSGIGGMTVLADCRKYLKNEQLYYYGDNARAPYGNLSTEQIHRYVFEVFAYFQSLQVKLAVVACNTATAVCIEELRSRFDFPVVGTEPALRSAARSGGEILVLATRATCESIRFQMLKKKVELAYPQAKIIPIACEKLAGRIEKYRGVNRVDYTPYLPRLKPRSVVLGCTHYIYIERQIQTFYGCPIYHGNEGIARRVVTLLNKDREERPQCIFDRRNQGRSTTIFPLNSPIDEGSQNTNKSLCFNMRNPLKIQEVEGICFLGESGTKNAEIYKQTFVRDCEG